MVSPVGFIDLIADISGVVQGLAVPQAQIAAAYPGAGMVQDVKVESRVPLSLGIVRFQLDLPEGYFLRFQKACFKDHLIPLRHRAVYHSAGPLGVRQDVNVRESIVPHQLQHGVRLPRAYFEVHPPALRQGGFPVSDGGAVKVQAILPAVQGQVGLEVPHGPVQRLHLPTGDIGRVAGDALERADGRRRRGQGVQNVRLHPVRQAAPPDVPAADPQGFL